MEAFGRLLFLFHRPTGFEEFRLHTWSIIKAVSISLMLHALSGLIGTIGPHEAASQNNSH